MYFFFFFPSPALGIRFFKIRWTWPSFTQISFLLALKSCLTSQRPSLFLKARLLGSRKYN